MTRYRQEREETQDGWTREIYPVMDGYKFACCDCGLVHILRFQVQKVTRRNKDGSFRTSGALKGFRVMLQAKRDNRATAAMRRERAKRGAK